MKVNIANVVKMNTVTRSCIHIDILSSIYIFLDLGLPAARMGVKIGDEIERVNDKSVRYSTHAQIVTTIHEVRQMEISQMSTTLTILRVCCIDILRG